MVDPNQDDESLIEQSQNDVRREKGQNGINKFADQAIKKASKKVTNKLAEKGASKAVTSALLPIMPYIIIAVVIIIVIILIIGIIAYFLTMPGMLAGKLKGFVQNIGDRIQSIFENQAEAFVNDGDVIELANYLSNMGYDLVGYGFVDPVTTETYKNVEELIEDGYKIVTVKNTANYNDESFASRIYLAKDENDFSTYYTDKFYYSTGALYNGFDSTITTEEALKDGAGTESGLIVKDLNKYTKNGITYSDNNRITDIEGNTSLLRNYLIADKKVYLIRNYDEGLLKTLGKSLKEIWTGQDSPSWTKGSLELFVAKQGNAKFLYDNGIGGWLHKVWTKSKISVVDTKLKVKAGWFNNPMMFEMDGWSGRYGLSKDFLISLHLATLSPDFVETMAQTFDTRIQVYMDYDDSASVEAFYKTEDMPDYVNKDKFDDEADDSAWPFDGFFVSKKEAKEIMREFQIKSMSTGRYACCGDNSTEVLYGSGNGSNRVSGYTYGEFVENIDWYDNVIKNNDDFVMSRDYWATSVDGSNKNYLLFTIQDETYGHHNQNNHGNGDCSISFHKKFVYIHPNVDLNSYIELEEKEDGDLNADAESNGIDVDFDDKDGDAAQPFEYDDDFVGPRLPENRNQSYVDTNNSKSEQLSKVNLDDFNVSSRDDSEKSYNLVDMKYQYPEGEDDPMNYDFEYYSNSNYFRADKMASVLNMLNKYYRKINTSTDLNIVNHYENESCPLNPLTAFWCDDNDVPLIEKYIQFDELKNLDRFKLKNEVLEIEIVSWETNDSGLDFEDPGHDPDEDGSITLSLLVRQTGVDKNYDFAAIAYRTKSYAEMGGVEGEVEDLCSDNLDKIKGVCSNCRRYISDIRKGLKKIEDEDFSTYQPYIARVVGSWFRDTYFVIPNSVDDGVQAILDDDIGYSEEDLTGSTVKVIKNDEQFLKETGELWTKYLYDNNYSHQDYALFVMNSQGEYLENENEIAEWKDKYNDDKLNEILKDALYKLNTKKTELEGKINNTTDAKQKEEYEKQKQEIEEKIKNVNEDIDVIKSVRDNYISYLEFDSEYYYGYLDVKGISENNKLKDKDMEKIFNEYDIALIKRPETQSISEIDGVEGFSGWSVYNFDSKENNSIVPVDVDNDSPKYIQRVHFAYNNSKKMELEDAEERDNYEDENIFYYKLSTSYNITQEKDAQRGMTNPKVKYLFKNKKYYKYDGTLERANQIYSDWENIKDYYLNSVESWDDVSTNAKAKLFARTTIKSFWFGPLGLIDSMNDIDDNKDNLKLSVLDGYIDNIYYNDIDDELFDFARDFDNDGIADIASPNVINKTEYNGLKIAESTIKTLDPRNPNLISNIDIGTESLEMFSILENTHTQDADYAYRDLKELFCELNYFDKEDLTEPTKEVLEWILPESGSAGWPNRAFDKKVGEYGSYIHTEEMTQNLCELISISDGIEEVEEVNNESNDSNSQISKLNNDDNLLKLSGKKIASRSKASVSSGGCHRDTWLDTCQACWEAVIESNPEYGAPGTLDWLNSSQSVIDCSGFVGFAMHEWNKTEEMHNDWSWLGTSLEMQTDYNQKYGFEEIPISGPVTAGMLQEGDLLLRSGSSCHHVCIIKEITENGQVWAYDCGGSNHWRNSDSAEKGFRVDTWFMTYSDPGKIIRIGNNKSMNSSAKSFNGAEKDTPIVVPATCKILEMGVTTVQNENTEDLLKTMTVIDGENVEENKNSESNLYVTPEIENAIEKAAKEKEEDNNSSFGKEYQTGYIKLEVICDDENSTDEASISQMKAAVASVGLDTAFIDDFYNDYRQESTKKSICDGYVIYIEGIDFRLDKTKDWDFENNSIINKLVTDSQNLAEGKLNIIGEEGEEIELETNYYTKKEIPTYYPKAIRENLEQAETRKEEAPNCVSITANGKTSEIFLKAGTLIGTAGDANIRIIMKDKDDAVVENIEDYMEIEENGNSSGLETDLTEFFFLPYEGGCIASYDEAVINLGTWTCADTTINDGLAGVAVGVCCWTSYANASEDPRSVQNLFQYIVDQEPKFSALKKYAGDSVTGQFIYNNKDDISQILIDLDRMDHDRLLELELQYAKETKENQIRARGVEWILDRSSALKGTYYSLINWLPNVEKRSPDGLHWTSQISPDKSDKQNIISLMKFASKVDASQKNPNQHYGRFNSQCRMALDMLEGRLSEEDFNLWMNQKSSPIYQEGQNPGYIDKCR